MAIIRRKKEVKSRSKKIFKNILLILVVFLTIVLFWLIRSWIIFKNYEIKNVAIYTDKARYEESSSLRLKIENNSQDVLCFSNFFPYFLERKEDERWALYRYEPLPSKDLIVKCMAAGEIKAFETILFGANGLHRVAIPFCANCKVGSEFKANKIYHSNEFIIK